MPIAFAALLVAPLLSLFVLYVFGKICESMNCLPGGEANWQPLLLQLFATPIFWASMVTSASLKSRRNNA